MKALLSIIALLFISQSLFAQDCTENLFQANQLFKKGLLTEAIGLAEPCSSSDNTTIQWKSYRMIALCQIALGNGDEARQAAEKMMELNPKYKPNASNESIEFVKLLNSITMLPKLSVGLTTVVGYNRSTPNIINSHNAANYQKEYTGLGSWRFGLTIGYNFTPNLSLHSGLVAVNKRYDIEYAVDDRFMVDVRERLTYLDIPLFLRFQSPITKQIDAFVNIGGYAGGLVGANSDFILTKRLTDATSREFSSFKLNSMDRKNKTEYGLLAGIGLNSTFNNSTVAIELNYYKGINYNLTNADQRYANSDLFLDYFYLDDDLRLDNLAISLSYILNINHKVYKGKN